VSSLQGLGSGLLVELGGFDVGVFAGWLVRGEILRVAQNDKGTGVVGDPQDLRPGIACGAPTGLLDRGYWGNGSALRWAVVAGWLARSEILRVAQNDKGNKGGFPARFLFLWCLE